MMRVKQLYKSLILPSTCDNGVKEQHKDTLLNKVRYRLTRQIDWKLHLKQNKTNIKTQSNVLKIQFTVS